MKTPQLLKTTQNFCNSKVIPILNRHSLMSCMSKVVIYCR